MIVRTAGYMFVLSAILMNAANGQVIESTLEPKEPVLLKLSVEEFRKSFSTVDLADMANAENVAIDIENGIAVWAPQGRLNLDGPYQAPSGQLQYIVTLIDENSGEPLKIQSGSFNVTDQSNNPVDFILQTFEQTQIPASVTLVIDKSGSMGNVMESVVNEANSLFERLPGHMHCEAIVFADTMRSYGDPSTPCTPNDINLSGITAGGHTNIFAALRNAFKSMASRTDHTQKMVLVLTDGDPSDFDPDLFAEVQKMKGDTQAIFFWLGNKSADAESLFAPLADHYVDDPQGAWRYLDQYFGIFTAKVNNQTVVTIGNGNTTKQP